MLDKLIQLLKNFFGISYKEGRGFVILFALLFIAVLTPGLVRNFHSPPPSIPPEIVPLSKLPDNQDSVAYKEPILFSFDPNTITYDSLLLLGLDSRVAARLVSYRNKGGQFAVKKDLLKIYDLPEDWYASVSDSLSLPQRQRDKQIRDRSAQSVEQTTKPLVAETTVEAKINPEDLNSADTIALKSVYGIGSVLSSRIVRFRDRLGGFISWDQLGEVYGLDAEVVVEMQKYFFIENGFDPRKININQATFKEVLAHPYLDYNQTKAIVNYRDQHGNFASLADLKAIHLLSDSVVVKLGPYLSYE
jgi:DNA uptake protein ComE-like DNA-binding protein